MKKINIIASIDGDKIAFSVQKSKEISLVEIIGLLDVITNEIRQNLQNKIKISKDG